MRVLITGGGTAGHVNPALAIADIIWAHEPDSVIEYVGTANGIEGRLVAKRGMKLHPIEVMGLARSLSPSNLKAVAMALRARKRCVKIIESFSPDVVVGTGGYVCWPLISAAARMGVPAVLHESNAEPGFSVKTLKNKADLILVNFESTKAWLRGGKTRVERVGMPVNKDFLLSVEKSSRAHISALEEGMGCDATENRDSDGKKTRCGMNKPVKRILSFGGSLGAHTLNICALRLMQELAAENDDVHIEHSCGAREYGEIRKEFESLGLDRCSNITISDYIYDMPKKMANADLVICRSGASTLAELAACGKASILIPSPNVTGDQQRKNARQLSDKGAAIVIEDAVAADKIVETVKRVLWDEERLSELSRQIKDFAVAECDERIYALISELIAKK